MESDRIQNQEWPEDGLERVESCPVCGAKARTLLHSGLTDRVFFCAPGEWTLYSCNQCHSAYLDPRPTAESIGLAYKNYFTHTEEKEKKMDSSLKRLKRGIRNGYLNKKYDTNLQPSIAFGRWLTPLLPQKRTLNEIYRNLPPRFNHGKLIDIGCGNGTFLKKVMQLGWEAWGTDFDKEAIEIAKRTGANIVAGNANSNELPSNYFDYVTMSHIIEHLHDPLSELKGVHRILKSGGTLWLATPNINSLTYQAFGANYRGLEPPRHLILFNQDSIKTLLEKSGFTKIKYHSCAPNTFGLSKESELISIGISPSISAKHKLKINTLFRALIDDLLGLVDHNKNEFLIVTAQT